ncbi:MAG: major facilitator superfamily protein [Rubritepida sp.]|nr:major facilitator superfamily protein [Rubritepida sp.]
MPALPSRRPISGWHVTCSALAWDIGFHGPPVFLFARGWPIWLISAAIARHCIPRMVVALPSRILLALAALLFLGSPAMAARTAPPPACPDILLGDSLAVGMGPYARRTGFEVLARQGVGLAWLRAQHPRCARRLIVVIGTNDVRGMSPAKAAAYVARVSEQMGRWRAQQVIWATPGCFARDPSLDLGSAALDRALAEHRRRGRGGLGVSNGRQARCGFASADGVHPAGLGYRNWWQGLAQMSASRQDLPEPLVTKPRAPALRASAGIPRAARAAAGRSR